MAGASLLLAAGTFAQTLPPNTTRVGQVIDLHGLGNANGRYVQWAGSSGGDWTTGWLKQNPDGSSHQLFARFSGGTNASKDLTNLFVIDVKTGVRTTLLPSTSRLNWALSWVGPDYIVLNRTTTGLFFGSRGTPSSLKTKEISGHMKTPNLT